MSGPPWRRDPRLEALWSLAPSASTPVLMELAATQAARRRPADVLAHYRRDRVVQPSAVDQRTLHRLDGVTLEAADEFEALVLSPVAPLGVCSTVAPTSQDRVLSTARGSEVVSDPTNVLALECARRLRAAPHATVRLCSNHQTLRMQPFPDVPGYAPHFRLFGLAEAGPARPEHGLEIEAVVRIARVFDRVFDGVSALGARLGRRHLVLFHAPHRAGLVERTAAALAAALPAYRQERRPLESRYYDGLRVMLGAETPDGVALELADIGVLDWMPRLTADGRHRLVTGGVGPTLLWIRYRAP